MPETEHSLKVSNDLFMRMQAERRWELHTRYGTDHRPEENLEDAVKAHLERHRHPADAPVPPGTVIDWRDGKAVGNPRPLHVELASRKELAEKKAADEATKASR